MLLEKTFRELAGRYSHDPALVDQCWKEIKEAYSHHKRHYHTLQHLENLLQELEAVRTAISDYDTLLFTLFYHDVVYKASKNDNEEKSAELALERMQALIVPKEKIQLCQAQVLATKKHAVSENMDTNLFTDADLSILGKDWPEYENYYRQVRKEYALYPDLLYKPERRKVLQHFLSMERIFKTDLFRDRYEAQARENLGREIVALS